MVIVCTIDSEILNVTKNSTKLVQACLYLYIFYHLKYSELDRTL